MGVILLFSDFKWLVEIIKSGGNITTGIAVACGLFLIAGYFGWLIPLDPWMILLAKAGLLLFGSLSIIAMLSSTPVKNFIEHRLAIHNQKRSVQKYIPHMTDKEKEIISYLLAKNQKSFMYAIDGGYAATLISRGIVVCALKPGQVASTWYIPFIIPDHIWSVLSKYKSQFKYKRPPQGENEVHPWAIPWELR